MAEIRHAQASRRPLCPAHSPYSREVGGKSVRKDVMLPCAFPGYDVLKCFAERSLITVGTGSCQR